MQRFFINDVNDSIAILNQDESKHIIKTLRYKKGETIELTDGKGNIYLAELANTNPSTCEVKIIECRKEETPIEIIAAVAPTKNMARMEWLVEKLTEVGITRFVPVVCTHSERKVFKTERLKKIALEAMKQSGRAYLPKIDEIIPFPVFIEVMKDFVGQKFILSAGEHSPNFLYNIYKPGIAAITITGPEGDFTNEELQFAINNGFIPVSLGEYRLRTETAALNATVIINSVRN
jgi:16S rRNA (uracil1498-N3)-methyltransferase